MLIFIVPSPSRILTIVLEQLATESGDVGAKRGMCDAWVWHMGVVQEVTAADGDHRTGWTTLGRLIQSSFYLFWSDTVLM